MPDGILTSILAALFLASVLVFTAVFEPRPRRRDLPRTLSAREREEAWIRRKARHRVELARRAAAATEEAHARMAALRAEFHATPTCGEPH